MQKDGKQSDIVKNDILIIHGYEELMSPDFYSNEANAIKIISGTQRYVRVIEKNDFNLIGAQRSQPVKGWQSKLFIRNFIRGIVKTGH